MLLTLSLGLEGGGAGDCDCDCEGEGEREREEEAMIDRKWIRTMFAPTWQTALLALSQPPLLISPFLFPSPFPFHCS